MPDPGGAEAGEPVALGVDVVEGGKGRGGGAVVVKRGTGGEPVHRGVLIGKQWDLKRW